MCFVLLYPSRECILFCRGTDEDISTAMANMGIQSTSPDASVQAKLGRDLFDTVGKFTLPFAPGGALSDTAAIIDFPKQFYMILRIIQLLRALSSRLDTNFSTAQQWVPLAERAVQELAVKYPNS